MLDNPRASQVPIPTSWDDSGDLAEELWNFVFAYTVDDQFVPECSWIVISLHSDYSAQDVTSLLKTFRDTEEA